MTNTQNQKSLALFLDQLCTDHGFCGTPGFAPVDLSRDSWTADEFAHAVLEAEGMLGNEKYFRLICDEFKRRYGERIEVL